MVLKNLKQRLKTLSSVIKANKTEPITQLLSLYSDGNYLFMGATDFTTTIATRIPCEVELEPMTVSLTELFAVVKTLKWNEGSFKKAGDTIQLSDDSSVYTFNIVVEGNKYLQLPIHIEQPKKDGKVLHNVKTIKARNNVAVGEDVLTNYYLTKKSIITTDGEVLAITKNDNDFEMTLPSNVFKQLSTLGDEVTVEIIEDGYLCYNDDYIMQVKSDSVAYPFEVVAPFIGMEGTATTNKGELQVCFQRLHDLGKDKAYIGVAESKLLISDQDNSVIEGVDFSGELSYNNICLDVDTTLKALKTMKGVVCVDIHEKFLVLSDDDGCFIISRSE